MSPQFYLQSLIEGQKVSSIPVQIAELEFLMALLKQEERNNA